MKYPPVDSDFYSIGASSGMSDDEIQADWNAYCDDLEKFHKDLDAAMQQTSPEQRETLEQELANIQAELDAAPLPVQHGMQPLIDDLKKIFKEPNQNG